MTKLSDSELRSLLQQNPDLQVDGDYMMPVNSLNGQRYKDVAVPKFSEHDFQTAVISECDRRSVLRVEYGLIMSIPNGGARHPAVAGKLKAEGVRAGVPDLFLPCARRGYHGFWIELKVKPNKPTEAQLDWLRKLKAEGYLCHVVYDEVKEVMGLLDWYLEGKNAR